jgi:hypothetical protein
MVYSIAILVSADILPSREGSIYGGRTTYHEDDHASSSNSNGCSIGANCGNVPGSEAEEDD